MINPIDLNKSIFNTIDSDIQKKSAETSGSSVDSIGIDMLPLSACKKEGSLAPYLSPPVMKKVDMNELRERLINELQNPDRANNVNETSILYIILLMNKINSDLEFSKTVEQEKVNKAIYETMINGFNDLKSYNDKIEFINKVLNIIKTIATSAGAILPLLYMGSPGVFFLLIEVADKIYEVMAGKSFLEDIKNEINDKIITPFLGKISDEIFKGLVSLGVNESQAKAIADELAKLILAGLLLSSLKFIKVETAFEKEILAQLTKLIEERLPFNKDTFNLISAEIVKGINTALPEDLRKFLQPLEKEIEAAFARFGGQFASDLSRFSGSMIDIVSRFISEQQLDAGAVEKALAALESSLQTELGKLLHELFSTAKGNLLALEEKFVAELVSGFARRVTAALRAVLPEELHGRLQALEKEIEAAFARFANQYIVGDLNSDRNTVNGAGVTFTGKYAVSSESDNDMAYQINQNLNAVHKTIYANVISDALASLNADTPVKTTIRARLIA